MDNQHRLIKGYKELSEEQIQMMNLIKDMGKMLKELTESLRYPDADMRWVDIGTVQLQQGLMALTRAVAQPDFF